jgi:hypothetical protein
MDGLFVSSVEGHAVTRYGTTKSIGGVPSPGLLIGAERDPGNPNKVTWDTNQVVHIPEHEARIFAREYARALRDGALVKRTEGEYIARNGGAK